MVKHQCMNCKYCEIHETKPYTYEYLCVYGKENNLEPAETDPWDFCDNGEWDMRG